MCPLQLNASKHVLMLLLLSYVVYIHKANKTSYDYRCDIQRSAIYILNPLWDFQVTVHKCQE